VPAQQTPGSEPRPAGLLCIAGLSTTVNAAGSALQN